jgi:hypothetical protein
MGTSGQGHPQAPEHGLTILVLSYYQR